MTSQFSMMSTPSASARAQVALGDRIVPGRPPRRCSCRTRDGVADVRLDVERRAELLRLDRPEPLVVDAVVNVCVSAVEHLRRAR